MLRLSNLRIGTKLAISSGVALLLVIAIVGAEYLNIKKLRNAADDVRLESFVTRRIADIRFGTDGMQTAIRDIQLARAQKDLQQAVKELTWHFKNATKNSDAVIAVANSNAAVSEAQSSQWRNEVRKIKDLSGQLYKEGQEIAGMRSHANELEKQRAGANDPLLMAQIAAASEKIQKRVHEHTQPLSDRLDGIANQVTNIASKQIDAQLDANDDVFAIAQRTGLSIGFLATVVLIGSAFLGFAVIAKPLRAMVKPLEEVAHGDFSVNVPGLGRKDEIGEIATAVEMVVGQVGATISNIRLAANEVTSASAEISTSTTDLSQRTEEQAASLEETSASMEQISATVRKNAENARQANEFANETNVVAERGGAVVGEAVGAMARIEESSRRISDIIGVIDEIARQTNLLALNAAVEAARAGEAGRGFAVVASEVRNLAQRSSQAAKDIKELITSSSSQVKDGVDLVNKAGASLDEIVTAIKKVTDIVGDIANASMEQATGLEQINKALTQMDEVTQQNSALVEENAATAKTLEHQARSMDERVALFRLRVGGVAEPAPQLARQVNAGQQRLAAPPSRRPAAPARKPAVAGPKAEPVAAPKKAAVTSHAGGPVGRMQQALAAAVSSDQDWKEF